MTDEHDDHEPVDHPSHTEPVDPEPAAHAAETTPPTVGGNDAPAPANPYDGNTAPWVPKIPSDAPAGTEYVVEGHFLDANGVELKKSEPPPHQG